MIRICSIGSSPGKLSNGRIIEFRIPFQKAGITFEIHMLRKLLDNVGFDNASIDKPRVSIWGSKIIAGTQSNMLRHPANITIERMRWCRRAAARIGINIKGIIGIKCLGPIAHPPHHM